MVQSVRFTHSFAIMLSVPLQLFPAVRIMGNRLFTRSGKCYWSVKWAKNWFRFATFLAFIACFACVPLCHMSPAMLRYKACADTRREFMLEPDDGGPPVSGNCP
ncbi:hypothetical protein R3P38DRAFT_3036895 [Favolaschia claudopus]|uniref:Uncharacterized protein n=1 Tax=Favolaschia claudopus TaxID=2862362 RepID=A0AAW0AAI9_9AGAR